MNCLKHDVPITYTITDMALCAVCEAARADELERRARLAVSRSDVGLGQLVMSMQNIVEEIRRQAELTGRAYRKGPVGEIRRLADNGLLDLQAISIHLKKSKNDPAKGPAL